uniref:Feline leukemia virus subgroup C receptor-related protein 2-like n=1 Tax=Phallusia mammillata TaxID=59560 RepID=A0A6F9DDT6_9ASCI|nr:feline leukemia virus subgroup C receptor-related protein 2-like [Phallusia mammillata]
MSEEVPDGKEDVHLYKRRWVFLLALTLLQVLSGFSFSCFGQISNFFVSYFHVTYVQVDWMTLVFDVPPLVLTVPFAWLTYRRYVQIRILTIFCAFALTGAYASFALSLIHPNLFGLSIIGQALNGLAAQVLMATPSIFGAVWFAENEIGTAISLNLMGVFAGYGLGVVLPTNLLSLSNTSNTTNNSTVLTGNRNILLEIYSCSFGICFLILVLLCIWVTDVPPKPPTVAQARKSIEQTNVDSSRFWFQTGSILTNKTFIMACIIFGIIFEATTVEFTMMSQIFKAWAQKTDSQLRYDAMGGYVICFYSAGSICGTIPAAKLVDKYKNYKVIAICGTLLTFLGSVGVVLGVLFTNVVSIYVSNVVIGFFTQVAMVSIYEIVTQHTYPVDETFVTIWLIGIMTPMGVFYGEIGRVIFQSLGGLAVVIFQAVNLFLSAFFSCFLSPEYRRFEMEEPKENGNANNERQSLLH